MALLLAGIIFCTGYVEVGPTASGVISGPGVAACPPDVRMGTRLVIEGVGEVQCLDRYASWLSPRVDVWVPTVPEAYHLTGQHAVRVLEVPAA